MKVAILTLPLGHNYGGILQAYALQKFVLSLGHDVEFLNRRHKISIGQTLLDLAKQTIKLSLKRSKNFKIKSRDELVLSPLIDFRDRELKLTEELYSSSEISKLCKEKGYDAIIVGSDQVWRPCYSPSIENYFLNFLDDFPNSIRRVSYAASFGVGEWEFNSSQTHGCKNLLKRFDAVSVREEEGVKLAQEHLNINAEYMVDPTLLLGADDYDFSSDVATEGSSGICTYILDPNAYKNQLVINIAGVMDLGVVCNKPRASYDNVPLKNIDDCVYKPVEDWINNIRNSEFVITDSFHGCVFSIIFNKDFLVVGNKARGLSRFSTLLKVFGLEDRMLLDGDGYESVMENQIAWNDVNDIRNDMILNAKKYMNAALGE